MERTRAHPDIETVTAAEPKRVGIAARLRRRYLDILGSIYIYNEHRGYTALDRVLEAASARFPDDPTLIAAITRHRADEAKHYVMFRRWFERRGTMPYAIDRAFGHIDRFVEIMFGSTIDDLDTGRVIGSDEQFARLCRVISLTERRGLRQVKILLRNSLVRSDAILVRILEIIEKDEPSHWAPYEGWLEARREQYPKLRERAIDSLIHSELLLLKLPLLFFTPRLRRRAGWPDAADPAETRLAGRRIAPLDQI